MNKYTEEDKKLLRNMYENDVAMEEIIKGLGKSRSSIRNKAYSMGITKPKGYTNYEKKYIRDHYKSYNLQEIANHLKRPKTNIVRWAKENGLERTNKKKNPEQLKPQPQRKTPKELREFKSKSMKEWHATHEHPRGMLGKTHTREVQERIRRGTINYFKNATDKDLKERRLKSRKSRIENGTLNAHEHKDTGYSRGKDGYREDISNDYFKSTWEANFARLLNYKGIKWEYEPKRFVFENVEDRPISYAPDFYLPEKKIWIEIKGWKDKRSLIKLDRFAKYYPKESQRLHVIGVEKYKKINEKYCKKIRKWE